MNRGSNILGGSFSNRNNAEAPIQFRKEREPQHLKRYFSSRIGPSIFILITLALSDYLNKSS